jgi:hypothetical protein
MPELHLLDERQPADAGADDDPDAVPVFGRRVELRVIDRHLRGHDRVVNEGVGLLDLFLLDPVLGIEALHFAGDAGGVGAGVELRDRADAGATFHQSLPRGLVAHAEGGDHADAGDDDATLVQEVSSFTHVGRARARPS